MPSTIRSRPQRGRPSLPVLVALLAAALGAAPGGAAAQPRSQAQEALDRAQALFDTSPRVPSAVGDADPRAATGVLRDLAARTRALAPAERAQALRLLARPTSGNDPIIRYRSKAQRKCDAKMCFWWVRKGADAPSLADRNRNGVPDWVDKARTTFAHVWKTEIGRYGYRAPRSDAGSRRPGPNGKLDIYVADTGRFGLYGYCTTDDPLRFKRRVVSAYCVVDDDFARGQFPRGAAGVAALRVTAAHEFFHAVQFAYDWLEDLWFMEGSAAWIEDEVYDGINDNRQYLGRSPLTGFWFPLDWFHPNPRHEQSARRYGAWIFFRYLSERFGRDVVRSIWRRADARKGAPNEYSVKAVATALGQKGVTLADVFADFGTANLFPARSYEEGAAYPVPTSFSTTAVPAAGVGSSTVPVDHLAHEFIRFVPGGDLPADATVTLTTELPPAPAAARAHAVARAPDGTPTVIPGGVGPSGHWEILVPEFAGYTHVTLVLTNAGARYFCWKGTLLSCEGLSRDDGKVFAYAASVG